MNSFKQYTCSPLQVAAQLANIYLLLGNEAHTDAADPTIRFVTTGIGAGQFSVEATSVHCSMDQAGIDSQLAEELPLLPKCINARGVGL